jgi:hypothetical protein
MADDMIEAAKKLSASNATKLAYALLWCVPIWCLLPFVAAALYSSPSTDDFCLSGHNSKEALAAVSQYYFNVTGRLPALMIITLPSLISRRMGLDLFALYPIFNVGVIITFVAAMIGGATMLLRTANHFIGILLGLLLCAFILSIVPNISEFIYWVTGEACYLTATIGAALFSAWVSRIVLERQRIDAVSLTAAIALCALTSMMNEFTVFFCSAPPRCPCFSGWPSCDAMLRSALISRSYWQLSSAIAWCFFRRAMRSALPHFRARATSAHRWKPPGFTSSTIRSSSQLFLPFKISAYCWSALALRHRRPSRREPLRNMFCLQLRCSSSARFGSSPPILSEPTALEMCWRCGRETR